MAYPLRKCNGGLATQVFDHYPSRHFAFIARYLRNRVCCHSPQVVSSRTWIARLCIGHLDVSNQRRVVPIVLKKARVMGRKQLACAFHRERVCVCVRGPRGIVCGRTLPLTASTARASVGPGLRIWAKTVGIDAPSAPATHSGRAYNQPTRHGPRASPAVPQPLHTVLAAYQPPSRNARRRRSPPRRPQALQLREPRCPR